MKKRKATKIRALGKVLFILYVLFLIYFLLFSDWYGRTGIAEEYQYNFQFFKEIKRFWEYRKELGFFAVFTNLCGNVLIFVPYGFFIAVASRFRGFFKTVCSGFLLSFGVEVFQLFTKVGSFDVDDLFLNTLGGALGFLSHWTIQRIRIKRRRRR